MILFDFVLFCFASGAMHFACAPRPCAGIGGCENENLTFYKYYTTKIFLCQSGAGFSRGTLKNPGDGFSRATADWKGDWEFFSSLTFYIYYTSKIFFLQVGTFFQGFSIERFRHERFITSKAQRPTDRPISAQKLCGGFLGGIRVEAMTPLASRVLSVPRRFSFFSHLLYILYYKNFFTASLPLYIFVVPGRRFGGSIRRRASPE